MKRHLHTLRLCVAAFVDTWNGSSAHYLLHAAEARNAILHSVCSELRTRMAEAIERAKRAEGECVRLEVENAQQREWLRLDELERWWAGS